MPQISLYIDEPTLKKIETAAKLEETSLSQWVRSRLVTSLDTSWPEGYLALFGSLKDSNLQRPAQPKASQDAKRLKL